jgi:hypothetical protein
MEKEESRVVVACSRPGRWFLLFVVHLSGVVGKEPRVPMPRVAVKRAVDLGFEVEFEREVKAPVDWEEQE